MTAMVAIRLAAAVAIFLIGAWVRYLPADQNVRILLDMLLMLIVLAAYLVAPRWWLTETINGIRDRLGRRHQAR